MTQQLPSASEISSARYFNTNRKAEHTREEIDNSLRNCLGRGRRLDQGGRYSAEWWTCASTRMPKGFFTITRYVHISGGNITEESRV